MNNLITLALIFISFNNTVLADTSEVNPNGMRVLVISDVDDTIKVSNVRDHIDRISYSVFKDSLFYGMNSVYQAIVKAHSAIKSNVYYLSNGWKPTVQETHQAILNDFQFPFPENYIARTLKNIIDKIPHKKNHIARIVDEIQPEVLILVGDNGEKDPKIYHEMAEKIRKKYQKQGKKIKILTFIHTVYQPNNLDHADLYEGQIPFSNAAELAVLLNEEKIITTSETAKIVENVVTQIKNEKEHSVYGPLVYPYFKYKGRISDFNKRQCHRTYDANPFLNYLNSIY